MIVDLCYFRFFEYCEQNNFSIELDPKFRYTTFILSKNDESVKITIDSNFDNFNDHFLSFIKKFNIGNENILIGIIKRKREINSPKITKYEEKYNKITTFHKHCY